MFLEYSIKEIHRKFGDGSLDPISLVVESIGKTNRLNPKYHIWSSFDADLLMRRARETVELVSRNK